MKSLKPWISVYLILVYFLSVVQIVQFILYYPQVHCWFPLSSPFCYWAHPLKPLLQLLYTLDLTFPFGSYLCFYFLLRLCPFSFVPRMFIIARGSIFMMTALKPLPDNPHICVMVVLTSIDAFPYSKRCPESFFFLVQDVCLAFYFIFCIFFFTLLFSLL